ncbi:MAG: 2,3-bisphosphoglycerate-independent phosphoglycerate mutase [Candidatus Marinimicrobia bacterium]|nr:2,3-bisphosphoglycerate-independent phosphoglycerate mutase [Candidatus Neomarinimicrobiota bacterium]
MKFILIILDGFGLRDETDSNAFYLAKTPVLDELFNSNPWATLRASGIAVGLPENVIGNSEVGHMTIGTGRIAEQDLVRINHAIHKGKLKENEVLTQLFHHVRKKNCSLHLIGLVSDGGVHSHINHIESLLEIAKKRDIKNLYLHAITDGRDTSPKSGIKFIQQINERMAELRVGRIATVMGRYYAMDRDKRWERTEIAYRAITLGEGIKIDNPVDAVKSSYDDGITDEFIRPIIITENGGKECLIGENDALLFFNFRSDRMRQICRALGKKDFKEFPRNKGPFLITTMTSYNETFTYPFLFKRKPVENTFAEILEKNGYSQYRLAETEKYAHVTYFFNGGEEKPFPHEYRKMIPSPKIATYDLQPEMSAYTIKEVAMDIIDTDKYDCLIMNLANMDMVGHTGDINATISAVETVDNVIGDIITSAKDKRIPVFITSDHGNQEMMKDNKTGEIHTAHTTNPVPFFLVNPNGNFRLKSEGGLSDIAPTILDYLGIKIPEEMTGRSLLIRE